MNESDDESDFVDEIVEQVDLNQLLIFLRSACGSNKIEIQNGLKVTFKHASPGTNFTEHERAGSGIWIFF